MDEGKFAVEFITANLEKIFGLGKKVYGSFDASIQTKLKTAYSDYLNKSRLKYSKSKSFFLNNQPVELYSYYVPTGVSCGDKLIERPKFFDCIEFTNRIVISGTGGSGKSVLMKHLFLDCIETKSHTPILIELRDLNSNERTLDEFVNDTLSNFGFNTTEAYINSAKKSGHFCYFLDGFDEITPKYRNKIIKQISSLSKKFPDCPIFISSRPDDALTGIDDFSIFKMKPLNQEEAIELVTKLPFDEVIKNKFIDNLSNGLFSKHRSFLSNPLLLSIMLLTYGENAEIPSKLSIFYNQAYEALFRRHDAYKGAFNRDRLTTLDIQDFSRIFQVFCLQTYEKRLFKMPRSVCLEFIQKSIDHLLFKVNASDYLTDLLSAACLMIEDGLEIAFSHRSFQEYFVALYISTAAPATQTRLVDRFWLNMSSDNVMHLLREINLDLFERVLLVPRLENLFDEIKVKKSVGISHLVRYLQLFYSNIHFDIHEDGGTRFTFHDHNSNRRICENAILRITVFDYNDYKWISDKELEEINVLLYEKYFLNDTEHLTKSLSFKSPLIIDLNFTGTWHSIDYLSTAYNTYKKLKSKHLSSAQNFDVLLGIK